MANSSPRFTPLKYNLMAVSNNRESHLGEWQTQVLPMPKAKATALLERLQIAITPWSCRRASLAQIRDLPVLSHIKAINHPPATRRGARSPTPFSPPAHRMLNFNRSCADVARENDRRTHRELSSIRMGAAPGSRTGRGPRHVSSGRGFAESGEGPPGEEGLSLIHI